VCYGLKVERVGMQVESTKKGKKKPLSACERGKKEIPPLEKKVITRVRERNNRQTLESYRK